MPDPTLGRCHSCDVRLSPARLRALLRRRALERLIRAGYRGHANLARRLRDAGFAATRNLVTKDLTLLSAIRLVEVARAVALQRSERHE